MEVVRRLAKSLLTIMLLNITMQKFAKFIGRTREAKIKEVGVIGYGE